MSIRRPSPALIKQGQEDDEEPNSQPNRRHLQSDARWERDNLALPSIQGVISFFSSPTPSPTQPLLPTVNRASDQRPQIEEGIALNCHPSMPTTSQCGNSVSGTQPINGCGTSSQRAMGSVQARRDSPLGEASTPGYFRTAAHKNRKDELMKRLEEMLGGDSHGSTVFLCWGAESCCRIIPVNVGNPADEVSAWRKIHRAWYAQRGYWTKHIPFFSVRQVDIAEVCCFPSI